MPWRRVLLARRGAAVSALALLVSMFAAVPGHLQGRAEERAEAALALQRDTDVLWLGAAEIARVLPASDLSGTPAVSVVLTRPAGAALSAFTARHVGEVIEVRLCGITVATPRVLTPLDGGAVLVQLPDGPDPADAVRLLLGEVSCANRDGRQRG